jgi:hypothetical protein
VRDPPGHDTEAPREGEDEAEGVLGDGILTVGGDVRDGDAQLAAGTEVDSSGAGVAPAFGQLKSRRRRSWTAELVLIDRRVLCGGPLEMAVVMASAASADTERRRASQADTGPARYDMPVEARLFRWARAFWTSTDPGSPHRGWRSTRGAVPATARPPRALAEPRPVSSR